MRAAYRLRGIGWMLSGVVIVLGCYLVSLQVAAERKRVADLRRAISQAQRQIRALETEFATRANIAQLERWNGDALALAAPEPVQYVADVSALAQTSGAIAPHHALAMIVPHARSSDAPTQIAAATPAAPKSAIPAERAVAQMSPPSAAVGGERKILASASIAPTAPTPRPRDRLAAIALLDRKLSGDRGIGALVASIPLETGGRQ